ncbi:MULTISPECIES: ScbA/BarX family gamma-butyrolactone biosynthesis protein [unclassified Streptomyces]|uniref:ScbA/BarX family gamma-butyrolactone biosynthesis protein n=1 Tax=unclassified Streptomyces TaxID=2593676 RepID=UPI00404200B8
MTVLTIQQDTLRPARSADTPRIRTSDMPKLTTTVPREYVHRSSHAEVFLTGCEKIDDTHYTLSGQWPRAHTFFTSTDGREHDPLQAAETIRQVGLFLAHAEFGVPLGHQFLMWDMHVTTRPEHMTIGSGPTDLTLGATVVDVVRRGNRLAEFGLEIVVESGQDRCAVGGGRFTCLSKATYQRIRGEARGALWRGRRPWSVEVLPSVVGKKLPFDVVLSPTDRLDRWLLNPDPRHPILFDHSGDHFPGMVLLEAARQAACALLHPLPMTVSSACLDFQRYVEFDVPCWIEATLPPAHVTNAPSVLITGQQGGHVTFTALLSGTSPATCGTGSAVPRTPSAVQAAFPLSFLDVPAATTP